MSYFQLMVGLSLLAYDQMRVRNTITLLEVRPHPGLAALPFLHQCNYCRGSCTISSTKSFLDFQFRCHILVVLWSSIV